MPESTPQTKARQRLPLPLTSSGPCWICGGTDLKRVFKDCVDLRYMPHLEPYNHEEHPAIHLVRCKACGFRQPEQLPALPDYFDAIYNKRFSEEHLESDYQLEYRDYIYHKILSILSELLPPDAPRTLLDVGGATGRFLSIAAQQGWESEGVDLDHRKAEFAARRTGRPVHACRAEDLARKGQRYSAVTLNDVLEHIPRPAPIVKNLRSLLEPGGILAIKVPHGPAQCLKESIRKHVLRRSNPLHDRAGVMTNFTHVSLFSVGSMRLMLERAGYRVLRITTGPPELSVSLTFRAASQRFIRKSAYLTSQWIPGAVHTPLAMHLHAFATPDER